MKITNRQELQQIAINYSPDTDFDEFKRLDRKCTAQPYPFLVVDTALSSDNAARFPDNL